MAITITRYMNRACALGMVVLCVWSCFGGEPPPKQEKKDFQITLQNRDVFIAFGELGSKKTDFEITITATDPDIEELTQDKLVTEETNKDMNWVKDERQSTKKRLVYKGVGNSNTEVKVKVVGKIITKGAGAGEPPDFAAAIINVDATAAEIYKKEREGTRDLNGDETPDVPVAVDGTIKILIYTVKTSNATKLTPDPTWVVTESVTLASAVVAPQDNLPEVARAGLEVLLRRQATALFRATSQSSTKLGEDVPKRFEAGTVPVNDDQFADTLAITFSSAVLGWKVIADQEIFIEVPQRGKILVERNTITYENTPDGPVTITVQPKP